MKKHSFIRCCATNDRIINSKESQTCSLIKNLQSISRKDYILALSFNVYRDWVSPQSPSHMHEKVNKSGISINNPLIRYRVSLFIFCHHDSWRRGNQIHYVVCVLLFGTEHHFPPEDAGDER